MNRVVLKAESLDGYLSKEDTGYLTQMDNYYAKCMEEYKVLANPDSSRSNCSESEKRIIEYYNDMGHLMQKICKENPAIKVYSFETEEESHAEASRVIAKLRDIKTGHHEFVYYTQRAYEMLFKMAYTGDHSDKKNHLIVKTPVTVPVQNYSVHKIPDIDHKIEKTVMCVMLRGALLPSMIMSKEIQEYSSKGYVTPFALFRIKRNDTKKENNMEYIMDLDKSYFKLEELDGKDLVFADPMNATGGSLVTVVKYLLDMGIKPKSIKFFNVIAALKGAMRVVRALDNCTVNTLWMDPVLNDSAYIMPGLGDAGDRINGVDTESNPRNMIQLIADYGSDIAGLYRSQLREIERVVLSGR